MDEKEIFKDLQLEASKRYVEGEGRSIYHLIEGFNKLITRVPEIFTNDKPFEPRAGGKYVIQFETWVKPQDLSNFTRNLKTIETERSKDYKGELWPIDVRIRKLSYTASLRMRVVRKDDPDAPGAISEPFEILRLPVMLRSDLCYLSESARDDPEKPHPSLAYEHANDVGGYFVILGREMVVLIQDHTVFNRDIVLRFGKMKEHVINSITIRHKSTTRQISIIIETFKSKEPRIIVNYHSIKTVKSKMSGISLMDAFTLLGVKIEGMRSIFRLMLSGGDLSFNEIIAVLREDLTGGKKDFEETREYLATVDREAHNMPQEQGKKVAYENFLSDLFPQTNNKEIKAYLLAYMTIRAVRVYMNKDTIESQNRTSTKQFQTPAGVIEKLIQQLWRKIRQNVNEEILNNNPSTAAAIANIINMKSNITNRIIDSFNTGRWGPDNNPKTGVVEEVLRELSVMAIVGRLTRIVVTGKRKSGNVNPESRMVDPEQVGTICLVTTPDSDQIGHTRNLTWTARISSEVNSDSVRDSIFPQIRHLLTIMRNYTRGSGLIFINATPIGWGPVREVFEFVRDLRRQGKITHLENGVKKVYFELSLGIKNGCLWMNTSSGRVYTPRIIIYTKIVNVGPYEIKTRYTKPLGNKNWEELLSTGVVEYIDPFEVLQTVIADRYLAFLQIEDVLHERINLLRKLYERGQLEEAQKLYEDIERDERINQKTHLSLDPTEIYADAAVMAPFANRNAGVRMALQSKMMHQAIVHQSPEHIHYFGQKYRNLVNSTAPLVCTTASVRSGQEFSYGEQIIVAFISLQGNQEDSIIWRKGAIDIGKLMVEVYVTEEVASVNTGAVHKFIMRPFPKANEPPDLYSYLGRDGVPEVGQVLKEGQVVIGVATCEMGKCNNYMKLVDEYYAIEEGIHLLQEMSEETYEKNKRIQLQRWGLVGKNLNQIEILETLVQRKSDKLKEIQEAPDPPRWSDSITVKKGKRHTVANVSIFESELGARVARVKIKSLRKPDVADKQNPRASQKATIGEIWRDEDMPFYYEGKHLMIPDVIVNSLAPFARQTNSWFLEMMTGFVDAVGGTRTLADAHRPFDIDWLFRRLREIGYRERSVSMINGRTGEYFGIIDAETGTFAEAKIFIGPSYQTALKHQVQDKGQVRGTGKRDIQTGLAVKGRSGQSGPRFGLMERDSTDTHGAAYVVRDRLLHSTAKTDKIICEDCGGEATFIAPNYFCRRCKNTQRDKFIHAELSRATEYTTKIIGMGNMVLDYKMDTKKSYDENPEEIIYDEDEEVEEEEIEEEEEIDDDDFFSDDYE